MQAQMLHQLGLVCYCKELCYVCVFVLSISLAASVSIAAFVHSFGVWHGQPASQLSGLSVSAGSLLYRSSSLQITWVAVLSGPPFHAEQPSKLTL
jgi:hypothetical protein